MDILTGKADQKARLTLPRDFAGCSVIIERVGDELRIRKAQATRKRRFTFRQLMAGVTRKNLHAEVATGPAVGGEALRVKSSTSLAVGM